MRVRMNDGRLIYLVGASGAGKDSVLARMRALLQPTDRIIVAHRYITRAADAGGENHVALTTHEFLQRRDAGCFALHWHSHGLHYGIGRELDLWLALGMRVVVNGSRAHVVRLTEYCAQAEVVEVAASEPVIRQRLRARGRESEDAIEARLARNRTLADCPAALRILNEGDVDAAAWALLAWTRGVRVQAS
jgi:ribose 1,5-bisphosphokinase